MVSLLPPGTSVASILSIQLIVYYLLTKICNDFSTPSDLGQNFCDFIQGKLKITQNLLKYKGSLRAKKRSRTIPEIRQITQTSQLHIHRASYRNHFDSFHDMFGKYFYGDNIFKSLIWEHRFGLGNLGNGFQQDSFEFVY